MKVVLSIQHPLECRDAGGEPRRIRHLKAEILREIELIEWHRQLGICRLTGIAVGWAIPGDTRDYAAMATPVTSTSSRCHLSPRRGAR